MKTLDMADRGVRGYVRVECRCGQVDGFTVAIAKEDDQAYIHVPIVACNACQSADVTILVTVVTTAPLLLG